MKGQLFFLSARVSTPVSETRFRLFSVALAINCSRIFVGNSVHEYDNTVVVGAAKVGQRKL